MWDMIPSLRSCVDPLGPAFTQPSFATSCNLLLAWVLCLGRHTSAVSVRTPGPRSLLTAPAVTASESQLREMVQALQNWALFAA